MPINKINHVQFLSNHVFVLTRFPVVIILWENCAHAGDLSLLCYEWVIYFFPCSSSNREPYYTSAKNTAWMHYFPRCNNVRNILSRFNMQLICESNNSKNDFKYIHSNVSNINNLLIFIIHWRYIYAIIDFHCEVIWSKQYKS